MGDSLLTVLPMENHYPTTLLSIDSKELNLEMHRKIVISHPPDINLPVSDDCSPTPQPLNYDPCELLDVGLNSAESFFNVPKNARKCAKRVDCIWGAWVFYSFYFKPALHDNSKAKIIRDSNGLSGFSKSDIKLDVFMVQHDLENMYMWVFKERPGNALGKMQLRNFMNGHSREGERAFPFSVDKGFIRSHRMQRKYYRGLSNPQCVHGIRVVPSPNLMILDEEERKKWIELTGRDINFTIPLEASDFSSWRNIPNSDYELVKPENFSSKKFLNGSGLKLSTELSSVVRKRKNASLLPLNDDDEDDNDCYLVVNPPDWISNISNISIYPNLPVWLNSFNGVMKKVFGPVTAAKSIYEDEDGYLIVISLPCVDLPRVKVSWRNTLSHGIVKVSCISTSGMSFIKRHNRTFKLLDSSSEHCPPGEFVREIPLLTRIPEGANIEAYYDSLASVLEIIVPKLRNGVEEHQVRVCLRPQL